jgi:hypothetical protein
MRLRPSPQATSTKSEAAERPKLSHAANDERETQTRSGKPERLIRVGFSAWLDDMNATEHLLTCLAEEGSEIVKDVAKSLRFGLDDRNVLSPHGPTNRERLLAELNDLMAVAGLLVEAGVLPESWMDPDAQIAKKRKVAEFMNYASRVGALSPN